MKLTPKILRRLIREEIGHNFKTKDNDPYQYYETFKGVDVEIYPTDKGYSVKVTVPMDDTLSSSVRTFPTEEECNHFGRQYTEYVKRSLSQRSK